MTVYATGPVDLALLEKQLNAAGYPTRGLGMSGESAEIWTYDAAGKREEIPNAAQPVVDAHKAPPQLIEFAAETEVHAIIRTTGATATEILRFPCEQLRLYQANLTISGVDAGNFVSKIMEGRFTWKRTTANAVMVGITVVSDIHDTAAAAWAPNAVVQGTEIVFTVVGAAGRTIDWLLVGRVGSYAPEGL